VGYGFMIMLQRGEKKYRGATKASHAMGTKLLGVGELGNRGMKKIEEAAPRYLQAQPIGTRWERGGSKWKGPGFRMLSHTV